MTLTYAEFCAGYGGLSMAVEQVFNADLKWYSEFEEAPSKIMAHHWPGVPNHGDMTRIDFTTVERVDILSGGTPCQDLSHAGRRAGMRKGSRSGLWESMREAIAIIQPRYVVWENVRGAYSAGADSEADSEVEPLTGRVGAGDGQPSLRALGRILGDLASLGFDAQWHGLRAADVGAPHGRFRVFVLAERRADADANDSGRSESWRPVAVHQEHAPTEHTGADAAYARRLWRLTGRESAPGQQAGGRAFSGPPRRGGARIDWGPYAPAIHRWEAILGRAAPAPTELTAKGKHRLSACFVEFMMGLPDGWVTGIDITRNEQLKALGNGVVTQQVVAALDHMLSTQEVAA